MKIETPSRRSLANCRRFFVWALAGVSGLSAAMPAEINPVQIRKLNDIVIYRDERFHSAFPSVVRRPDGELLVAFRRAPDRRRFGDEKATHTDPNSYLMMVRSRDDGQTWSKEPTLFFAHPFGGSQDPCMVQLSDNSIICTSYGWAWMPAAAVPKLPQPNHAVDRFVFLGGYLIKSTDGGSTWSSPILPPRAKGVDTVDIFGKPMAAHNRGALCEGADGRLYWVVAATPNRVGAHTETHLMISADRGVTWEDSSVVASDPKVTFNESSIYETPKGTLVVFMRTAGLDDHLCVARSFDHGKTFQKWEDTGFQGHPAYALRVPGHRVLLVYGYRHAPRGVRARLLDPECTNLAAAPETILRDDGGNFDLGYPWATMISKDRALVVYYFNRADGTRSIEGTFVQLP